MIEEDRRSGGERQPRCQHPGHKQSLKRCLGWLFLTMVVANVNSSEAALENRSEADNGKSESGIGLISPRMDYEEWTPLGSGDPLKNNPTFDYVPPVLDNVQYWLDSQTTEASASAKRDILVLGVTAKKASPKVPGRYFNLVDGIDGHLTSAAKQQAKSTEQHLQHRADFTGSTGAEPPNILRSSTFKHKLVSLPPPGEYSNNPRKIQREPTASYYPSPYYTGKHGGKLHTTTRLLANSHQLSQPTKAESSHQSYLSNFPSDFRFEESERLPSHKGYGSLKAAAFPKDRVRPTISVADVGAVRFQIPGGEATEANEGKFGELSIRGLLLPGNPTGILANSASPSHVDGVGPSKAPDTVTVEKSSLIYESSDTISGDWLEARPTLVPKPDDHRIMRIQLPHHTNHHQYDEDRDASPSANHPVVIPHNDTVGKTEYRPEMSNGDTPFSPIAENATSSNERLAAGPSIDTNVKSDNRSDHYSGHLPLDEWYNQQLTATDQEHIKQLHTGAPVEEMHIIIANSHSNESRVMESEQTSTSSLAIVMPMNYSNETLPAILKNIQLTTTTATPTEIGTHWSNSVDQLTNLTATGSAQVSDSASSSVSVPDTPKRVLVAPAVPPPLLHSHMRETQLSSMREYPGRNHVFLPPKSLSYSLGEQSQLHPHAHPQRYSNPLTHLRPNSHPHPHSQPQELFPPAGVYQPPPATMDSLKGHLPGAMTFLEGVHSTFSPQSAGTVVLPSTHLPIKVRQPLTPTFMSMPIEMRVSMTIPMPGTPHFSATTAHTASGMPSKMTWEQLLTKPGQSDRESQYAAIGSSTPAKTNPASPIFTDNGGTFDKLNSIVNGSRLGNNHHKANYRPSEEGLPKKGPAKLLANEHGSKEKGELRREAYSPDIERKPISLNDDVRSGINSLAAQNTADQDQQQQQQQQRVSGSAQAQLRTTTVASLTTDPIFSHYKQPAKPLRGPMYLIIQGHSKVKTYKPNANKQTGTQEDRVQQQEKQSIAEGVRERKLSKFDRYVIVRENAIKAERGVVNNTTDEKPVFEGNPRKADNYLEQGTPTLISLVESGLGQIFVSPLPVAARKKARGAAAGADTILTPIPCAPSASIFASRK